MNGRFSRAYFTFAPFGERRPAVHPGSDWKRLYAALLVSCLLHAALVLMPSLGKSTTVSRADLRGMQKPDSARVLDVKLKQESQSAPTVAGKRAAEAGAAESPARPKANEESRPALNRSRGTDLLPVPAPTYYTTDQLTRPPRPTSRPDLDVPREIARLVTGKVVLKLWIDESGNVNSAEVERSNLPEAVSSIAAAAFGKLRFVPGEIDGRPVRTLLRIEVAYVDGKRPSP
jgi:TonB family protein